MTGYELKNLRVTTGLLQRQLADKIGVSTSLIAHFEGGRKMITEDREKSILDAIASEGLKQLEIDVLRSVYREKQRRAEDS